MSRELLDPNPGIYESGGPAVLRGAAMPALVLEAGAIVNRDEEQKVLSGSYHPKIVAAPISEIGRYCDRHSTGG